MVPLAHAFRVCVKLLLAVEEEVAAAWGSLRRCGDASVLRKRNFLFAFSGDLRRTPFGCLGIPTFLFSFVDLFPVGHFLFFLVAPSADKSRRRPGGANFFSSVAAVFLVLLEEEEEEEGGNKSRVLKKVRRGRKQKKRKKIGKQQAVVQ